MKKNIDGKNYFEYKFQVSFEETNVVGNVYFANYFVWQGKCRELFLSNYAPEVLEDFKKGHGMITKDSNCEFFNESFAFNNLVVMMSLEELTRARVKMIFDYYRVEDDNEYILLAKGSQSAIWAAPGEKISMFPTYLYDAISSFSET